MTAETMQRATREGGRASPSSLRPRVGEDAAAWTRAVFAAGDYAGAAMSGDESTWQCHAARAMLRGDRASFAALADFADGEAQLHRGASLWIHGDSSSARRLLATLPLPHAQNLVRLIDQPRIRVLTQLPWLPDTPIDLLGGALHDPVFELRNVGYHGKDVQNHPYTKVGRFVDSGFAPDFYLAAMVEWHQVPPDLQTLPCPIFGHIADHDLHAQTLLPWPGLFDELCVTDRTEWLAVQGLSRARVSSFPKVFGLPMNLPPVPDAPRHLDFFVSGTMLDPYHPDKAVRLHELLSLPDINLRVVRGYTGDMAYRALLAASKVSFTFVRYPGALPTRGLEALSMGCAVALQEESVLRLFVGPDAGAVPYGPETGSLADAVGRVLRDWKHHGPAALRGAAIVREQFARTAASSQYLRFLTFRAAAPRAARERSDTSLWCQKRPSVSRTWLPGSPAARRRMMQANFRHLGRVLAAHPAARTLTDMARELLLEFAFYEARGQAGPAEQALFDDAVGLLERCELHFPDALAARFLRIRALLHHGAAEARARALQLAAVTIDRAPGSWQIDTADDVMPFDFHGDRFNYRDYLELVIRAAKGDTVPAMALARLILASLCGLVACETGNLDLHERAATLDPAFARYRLDWAKALLGRGDAGRAQARGLLTGLAAGSVVFATAARLLHELDPTVPVPLAVRRLDEDTIDATVKTRSLFDAERRAPMVARRSACSNATGSQQLSVLVPDGGTERELAALLTDLGSQVNAAELELVVATSTDRPELKTSLASFAGALTHLWAVDVAPSASYAQRLEACRHAATAPLLSTALAGDRFRPDAFAWLAAELAAHPDTSVVFANDGWTAHAVACFDPSACTELSCWPRFGRGRLLATNCIGLHPVWRRELHDRLGGFLAEYGAATEYEFWLRATASCHVRQLPVLLASSCLDAAWRSGRDPAADPAAAERARARHASPCSPCSGAFTAQEPLPAVLFAPAIPEEAASHVRLGILDDATRLQVCQVEEFYSTALLHGDMPTALLMLRTAVENVPSLLSARLALARLLAATGAPGQREVLEAARECEPYAELVARCLAALPPSPPHPNRQEFPCTTPQPKSFAVK